MLALRIMGAVFVGTLIAFVLGAAFDYYRIVSNMATDNLNFLFPAISALGGLLGSFAASMIAAGGSRGSATVRDGKTVPRTGTGKITGAEVPGMPTFDFSNTAQPGSAKLDASRPVTPPKEETRL
jgi:hypothetical protein